jgi:hypothetical protein
MTCTSVRWTQIAALALLVGCSSAKSAGSGGGGGGAGGSGGAGALGSSGTGAGAAGSAAGTVPGTGPAGATSSNPLDLCGGPCQCSDGIDNDGDGLIDGFDPECTGASDNDEGSFATGIPGDNVDPKWQDCFFDGNSGAGDDGCRYSTDCLTGAKAPSDPDCAVTQRCLDFCVPRTPNGCDCFGCCTFRKPDGSSIDVIIDSKCDAEHLDACQTCTPSPSCQNQCGQCELCPGKTLADLPASCMSTPPPPTGTGGAGGTGGSDAGTPPPPGVQCDSAPTCLSQSDCPTGTYCSMACCLVLPPI